LPCIIIIETTGPKFNNSKNRATNGLVAVKIIDIDKVDYEEMTTKNLQETLKEINILQQLKDSRARPYVNIIEEARTVHNELWIISEYASGGSVNTLMKPRLQLSKAGLEEKYIIPIARELALGLKFIHEAGVIHRDLKCNNILVLEDGRVQLCDFGVSGSLEPEIAKRSTIVGTPFWMAPELQKEWVKEADPTSRVRPNEILYGSEVDIWAYGCTVYEMATGFPPFHERQIFSLPEAGVPELQGDKFSDELKSFVASVLQPNPRDRPAPDQILEHPYIADSTKMYPTVTLVALVEQYYRWEYAGGSRVSLFNPYGAQAPDPLAPETEDGDEDWTFSTTDEFEKQFAGGLSDPFMSDSSAEGFTMNAPPQDVDRFARLQATIREEQADRGKKRLDRLFDTNSTPYRLSAIDLDPRRPPSDLILRDFNPGAPNRETVIDLDFAAPTVADVPSIDLGEVPTVKANRLNRIMREMDMDDEDEEERDSFDMDQTARRATRDWKFPSQPEQSNRRTVEWKFPTEPEQSNRRTVEWKFPTEPEQSNRRTVDWKFPGPDKTNRRTMEWTFDISMAEAAQDEPVPKLSRLSRRDPQELAIPGMPSNDNRKTRDFVFPMRDPAEGGSLSDQGPNFSSSPPGFQPSLRHATTEPLGSFDDYPRINSAPESPLRTSMIDLDMAMVEDYRPSTSDSASTSTYTAGGDGLNGNPFDLEDQVQLSQQNNRTSYHMKSQSEPNHAIPGLLTPQTYDEQGYPTNLDPHHPSMHARGVSSASQVQPKPPPNNIGYRHLQRERERQQQQPQFWDGWSHQEAFRIDESPPTSVSPATSASEEDTLDDRWILLEKQIASSTRRTFNYRDRRRQNLSRESQDAHDSETPRSDAEDNYASDSYDYPPISGAKRTSRVSMGPNGRPLVDFPVPRGPDPEVLAGAGMGGLGDGEKQTLSNALWKSTVELRDGLRASRDLLKSMRLADVTPIQEENEHTQGT
jgi:serine/threonine protein kinase